MALVQTRETIGPYTRVGSVVVALVVLACGARSSLEPSGEGAGGTGGGGAGPGGQGPGGAGAGGDGGAPVPCEALAWAGEPAYVTTTSLGPAPHIALIATLEDQPTLAYARDVQTSTSFVITTTNVDAWGAWPPAFSPTRDHLATKGPEERVDVIAGPPGFIVQAGRDTGLTMNVQASDVIDDAMLTTVLPQVSGGAHAIAEGPKDQLLIHGAPNTALATLLPSTSGPSLLGTFGCADGPIVADVASLRDRVFLVASSADAPFDDCLDPDLPGPPTTLHVHRIDGLVVTQGMSVTLASPIERVQLVRDSEDGAWLLYRAAGDPELHIQRLDDAGMPVWSLATFGNALYGDAVADWSTGFAHFHTWPGSPDNDTPPFVWLTVNDPEFLAQATSLDLPLDVAVERAAPAVLTSPDQRAFLVAWARDPSTIGILRADCL